MKSLSALKTSCTTAMLGLGALALTWLSGCSNPTPPKTQARQTPEAAPAPVTTTPQTQRAPDASSVSSLASNATEYRKDAATFFNDTATTEIYTGRLPPMLEAVGVLNVDIDRHGGVKSINWMRAPRHVPQVMKEIERMVKAAAPYPIPKHMSQVTYTDVWLWHKSGKFQLDTLTEGQD